MTSTVTDATLTPAAGTATHPTGRRLEGRHIGGAVFAVAAALWVFSAPGYWVFLATTGLVLGVAALGLLVVVGWAREVSLMQAGLTGTALYLCGFMMKGGEGWGLPYLVAAGLAIAAVVAISVLVSLSTAKLSGIYIIVFTLAVQVTIEKTVFTNLKFIKTDTVNQLSRPSFLGVDLHSDRAYFLFSLAVVGLVVVFLARLRASRFGRGLILVGTDRQVASSVGLSPWRAKIFAFALAGFCAGVAGALTAPLFPTPPSFIIYLSLNSLLYLAIPVMAGFKSLLAVTLVAMVFALAPQALEHYQISPLALGSIGLLLGMAAGPTGVSGFVLDKVHAYRKERARRAATVDLREASGAAPAAGAIAARNDDWALAVLEDYLPQRSGDGDVVVATDVSVAFGGLRALSEVSLRVPARQLVGLIGPNGAGKSTLFDVVNGLRKPDVGEIVLFGENVSRTSAWDRAALGLSRTFQSSRVNLDLTVGDNLLAGAYRMIPGNVFAAVAGLPKARAGERRAQLAGRAVAALFGLTDDWDETVRNLDFGTQRRVEIGRSLMSGPRLLLLDEPAAGLDIDEATALFALVRRLEQDLGLTVLLVEHYVKAVLDNCDLVYVLSQGRIIASGTPDEIVADPQVRAVYLGERYQREGAHADA